MLRGTYLQGVGHGEVGGSVQLVLGVPRVPLDALVVRLASLTFCGRKDEERLLVSHSRFIPLWYREKIRTIFFFFM